MKNIKEAVSGDLVANQQEIIRDLRTRLSQAETADDKKSLQLKIDVAEARLRELQNQVNQENQEQGSVVEEAPQQKKDFLDTDNNGNTIVQDPENEKEEELKQQLGESIYTDSLIADLQKRIQRAMKQRDMASGDARAKWQEGINSMRREIKKLRNIKEEEHPVDCDCPECKEQLDESLPSNYSESKFLKEVEDSCKAIESEVNQVRKYAKDKKYDMLETYYKRIANFTNMLADSAKDIAKYAKAGTLTEGCMSKKFENMTNRELASYIFHHPHTKFGDKMKECDTVEMMKAIRDMKKADEEVTTTAAVADAPKPSMYMKRPRPEDLED